METIALSTEQRFIHRSSHSTIHLLNNWGHVEILIVSLTCGAHQAYPYAISLLYYYYHYYYYHYYYSLQTFRVSLTVNGKHQIQLKIENKQIRTA